ncbi:hypothetical protein [Streptomyces sp. NPDC002215]|uniref:COG1470 family protein n=1 Tax=Streptomyces sp. NPDC002215 TaxID=3154412 RepID=UPI00332DB888
MVTLILTASTKDLGYTAFQQGSGRIQSDKAMAQTVHATPVALDLGTALYPHDDDEPIVKTLTYKNEGTADDTFDLTASGKDPDGAATPEGMFAVSPAQLTVPAGGTAEATFTADTELEAPNGRYTGAVVATGEEQNVRTAFAVVREVELCMVEVEHLGRDGQSAEYFHTYVTELSSSTKGIDEYLLTENAHSTTLRLPVGEYTINSLVLRDRSDLSKGVDWLAQPKLVVDTEDVKVVLDARTAKPVDIKVPDADAKPPQAVMSYGVKVGKRVNSFGWQFPTYDNLNAAHVGPEVTDGSLSQTWDADFVSGDATQYALVYGGEVRRLADGFTRHPQRNELAHVDTGVGSTAPGRTGLITVLGSAEGGSTTVNSYAFARPVAAPSRQHLYLSTEGDAKWTLYLDLLGAPLPNGLQPTDASYWMFNKTFAAGKTHRTDFDKPSSAP